MPSASSLCRLLQSHPNAFIIGQGRTGVTLHRTVRSHLSCARSGRIASPIRQDLICERDTGYDLRKGQEILVPNVKYLILWSAE